MPMCFRPLKRCSGHEFASFLYLEMIGPMVFHAISMYVDTAVLGRYSAIHAAVFSKSLVKDE